MDMTRRDLLGLGGLTMVGAALAPAPSRAQTPKRGGTLSLRLWDPPHFDPYLQVSYKTHIVYSFTHSRLVKHKVGPAVVPGTFAIEGDLAESWTQPSDTTYVFKLRRGVRWQAKPPVNGRELTAEDVVYSVDRFLTIKGNANASMLKPLDRVEAVAATPCASRSRSRTPGSSTCSPTRWRSASWRRSASTSSATSGARRPPWAPARGCSTRTAPTSA
jgi:ABC-type transport system substrate-binding protein